MGAAGGPLKAAGRTADWPLFLPAMMAPSDLSRCADRAECTLAVVSIMSGRFARSCSVAVISGKSDIASRVIAGTVDSCAASQSVQLFPN
jgi:hypothetical protein